MSARALLTESVLLSAEPVSDYFVIDADKRQIIPPTGFQNFGVESDEKSKRIYFQCPRVVGDNLDLTTLNLRVNYQNAKGEKDSYIVDDVAADGDTIYFSWLLSRKVTLYSGSVTFIVCAVKTDTDGVIVNEWNTSIATGTVLTGLEVETPEIPEDVTDLVSQLLDVTNKAITDMQTASAESVAKVQAAETEAVNNIAASLDSTLSISGKAAESSAVGDALNNKAPVIVITKTGESIVVNNAAQSALKGLKLYGKTTQDGTPTPDAPIELVSVESPAVNICGGNLFNAHTLELNTNTSFEVSEDGYKIVASGGATSEYASSTAWLDVDLLKGKKIILAADSISSTRTDGNVLAQIIIANSDGTRDYESIKSTSLVKEIDIPKDTVNLRFGVYTNNTGRMLESDNTVTVEGLRICVVNGMSWEEHKEKQSLVLPYFLHGLPVDSGGNYTDADGQEWLCDEIDLERGVYVQRTIMETWNDTNMITMSDDGTYFSLRNTKSKICMQSLCNSASYQGGGFLKGSYWRASSVGDTRYIYGNSDIDGNVCYSTVDELLVAVGEIRILGLLPEIIETPLTAEELAAYKALYTNYPVTTLLNDQSAHMELSYAADTDIYIKQHYVPLESYNALAARVAALEAGGV